MIALLILTTALRSHAGRSQLEYAIRLRQYLEGWLTPGLLQFCVDVANMQWLINVPVRLCYPFKLSR